MPSDGAGAWQSNARDCAVLIIGYIAYISFFDFGDWLGGGSRGKTAAPAAQASPTP